jgi:hypothetical protein
LLTGLGAEGLEGVKKEVILRDDGGRNGSIPLMFHENTRIDRGRGFGPVNTVPS